MEMTNAFTEGAREAHSLSHAWLIDAAKAARMAEEAKQSGDLGMAKLYAEQSERYYREADRCAERAEWYERRMGYGTKMLEAAE